ncbi:unnamed protein product [Gongylonema pulchrum]|uniref:SMC_N domain-containing protein n=1 Tax=Gongylonema pulchrum TaxID=637853 RepID=A0A183E5L2_9BILA|nr:unnamed protein product [Gongylonema pulchrum]
MRIKRIEIDGFKSYAQKQTVDGFDAQFNAITGLNGSGKSNILDAICFVLGITNLSQLSDLVYKQGQAGITKATVTITFDNTDPSSRPVGFDRYTEIIVRRQIVINGRNTYTINGIAATNSRVADMFRTVGLNVNNPHFLIMQGRITKVLNMKPMEIVINGRNTYTINGIAATNSRVADMFRTVGLNVNNPHFLIMQGRITKVLNMKPMEVRSSYFC